MHKIYNTQHMLLKKTPVSAVYIDGDGYSGNVEGELGNLPGEHAVVVQADRGRVRPVRPVQHDLLNK